MSYLKSPSATQWTVRTIVSTQIVQCWVGMKREDIVQEGTPHCQSLEMTTCFSGLYQIIITRKSVVQTRNRWTTMCGLMLTLVMSTTLSIGIGSTDKLPVIVHCWINKPPTGSDARVFFSQRNIRNFFWNGRFLWGIRGNIRLVFVRGKISQGLWIFYGGNCSGWCMDPRVGLQLVSTSSGYDLSDPG